MDDLEKLQGISTAQIDKLHKAGIRGLETLLVKGSTVQGRSELAGKTRISVNRIMNWVHRADLMRVKGIGSEYADLLEVAGVDTIRELRRRNPSNLLETLIVLNTRKRLVRRLPTEGMVSAWIEEAKVVDPVVAY